MPQDKRAPRARTVSGQPAAEDDTPLANGPVSGQTGTPPTEEAGRILSVLSSGEIELKGRIPWSSNATFLVSVGVPPPRRPGEALLAIYKPTSGERPLWDFPQGLWKREVAAYELCSFLGWDIVPPTTARPDGPLGPGPSSSASTRCPTSTSSLSSTTVSTTVSCAALPLSTWSPTMRTARAAIVCSTRPATSGP